MEVGFIGIGLMGEAMSGHILRGGFSLTVYNRTKSKADRLVSEGAKWAYSPAELAKNSDVIFICAGDGDSVKELIFGKDGAAAGCRKGAIIVDHTTIAPAQAEEIGTKLSQQSIGFLDAPVTGGDKGARAGKLTIMVGGALENLEKVREILSKYGSKISHVGPHGFGQKLKSVNQVCAVLNSAALSEAFSYAKRVGLDLNQCLEVLSSGAATSWVLENFAPRIINGDFAPGFSVKHSRKDIGIVISEAEQRGFSLRLCPEAFKALSEAADNGMGDSGNHALYKVFCNYS